MFKGQNLCKTLDLLLGKVFKEVLKISDEYITLIENKFDKQEGTNTTVQGIYSVLTNTIAYMEIFGEILDYLCVDSYKFD